MKRPLIIWAIVFSLIFAIFAQSVSADQIELPDVPIGTSGYTYHTVYPTCTEDGVSLTIRNRDGAITKRTPIPALGHDYIDAVIPPTSNEQGYTTHTCLRCGDTYIDSYTEPTGVYSLGDVNGDGNINGDDVSDLSRYIAKWPDASVECDGACDVNLDGAINGDDVSDLSRYVAKWPDATLG